MEAPSDFYGELSQSRHKKRLCASALSRQSSPPSPEIPADGKRNDAVKSVIEQITSNKRLLNNR